MESIYIDRLITVANKQVAKNLLDKAPSNEKVKEIIDEFFILRGEYLGNELRRGMEHYLENALVHIIKE